MVKIRLFKTGSKHKASFRIVAIDSRRKRDGQVLEIIGFYNPRTKPPTIKINRQKLERWLRNGAQLTQAVRRLIEK